MVVDEEGGGVWVQLTHNTPALNSSKTALRGREPDRQGGYPHRSRRSQYHRARSLVMR